MPRTWTEPLQQDANGIVAWGEFKVHIGERPWEITIVDGVGKTRQRLRIEPSTGANQ